MKNELNIVGIQSSIVWEKPAANLEYFGQQISKLPSTVDLVILPEMFTTGFSMNPISIAETMEGPSIKWMVTTAKTNRMALVGSVVIKENAKYFNRLFFYILTVILRPMIKDTFLLWPKKMINTLLVKKD